MIWHGIIAFQDSAMLFPSCLESLGSHQHAGQVLQRRDHTCLPGQRNSRQADRHSNLEAGRLHDELVMTGVLFVFGEKHPEE